MDFASVLGAKLEPRWPPFSLQDAQRDFQDTPRRPKTPAGRTQDAQNHLQTTILGRFWDDFRDILEDFWKSFGRIFWKMLLSNLTPFGGFSVCLAFLRAAYRATLARRPPALRVQY